MKILIATTAFISFASCAQAESIIEQLCGPGHINEVHAQGNVEANPDGYYVRDHKIQLSHGDPRIVFAVGDEFHLCTRSAAKPDMDETKFELARAGREVVYLFVPTCLPKVKLGS